MAAELCRPYMQYRGELSEADFIEQVAAINDLDRKIAFLESRKVWWEATLQQPATFAPPTFFAPPPPEIESPRATQSEPPSAPQSPTHASESSSSSAQKNTQRKGFMFSYTVEYGVNRTNLDELRRRFASTGIKNLVDVPRTQTNPQERLVSLTTIKRTTVHRIIREMKSLFNITPDFDISKEDIETLSGITHDLTAIQDENDRTSAENAREQGSVIMRLNALEKLLHASQKRVTLLEEVIFGQKMVESKKKKQKS